MPCARVGGGAAVFLFRMLRGCSGARGVHDREGPVQSARAGACAVAFAVRPASNCPRQHPSCMRAPRRGGQGHETIFFDYPSWVPRRRTTCGADGELGVCATVEWRRMPLAFSKEDGRKSDKSGKMVRQMRSFCVPRQGVRCSQFRTFDVGGSGSTRLDRGPRLAIGRWMRC